jgi:hypothetical protein
MTVAILAIAAYVVHAEELKQQRDKRGFAALAAFPAPLSPLAAPYTFASAPLAYAPSYTSPFVAAPLTARAIAGPAFAPYTYLA